jgi:hypothetical protein
LAKVTVNRSPFGEFNALGPEDAFNRIQAIGKSNGNPAPVQKPK